MRENFNPGFFSEYMWARSFKPCVVIIFTELDTFLPVQMSGGKTKLKAVFKKKIRWSSNILWLTHACHQFVVLFRDVMMHFECTTYCGKNLNIGYFFEYLGEVFEAAWQQAPLSSHFHASFEVTGGLQKKEKKKKEKKRHLCSTFECKWWKICFGSSWVL